MTCYLMGLYVTNFWANPLTTYFQKLCIILVPPKSELLLALTWRFLPQIEMWKLEKMLSHFCIIMYIYTYWLVVLFSLNKNLYECKYYFNKIWLHRLYCLSISTCILINNNKYYDYYIAIFPILKRLSRLFHNNLNSKRI